MNNTRFAVSIHILTLLAFSEEEWLSSEYIAGSINVNPAMIRKELGNLQEYGLIKSRSGRYGGSALAKPAEKIRISDIYQAVHPASALGSLRDQPNPKCPVGRQINQRITSLQKETEHAIIDKLGRETLAEFCQKF